MERISTAKLKNAAREKLAQRFGLSAGCLMMIVAVLFGLIMVMGYCITGILFTGMLETVNAKAMRGETMTLQEITAMQEQMMAVLSTPKALWISQVALGILGALLATLTTGYAYVCLKLSRAEETTFRDLFYVYRHNPDKVILIYAIVFLVQFVVNLPVNLLSFLAQAQPENDSMAFLYLIVNLVTIALSYLIALIFSQVYYVYADDCNADVIEIVKKGMKLMRGNKGRLCLLHLSFLGWGLLMFLSFGIAGIFIIPYWEMTLAEFYRNINGEPLWVATSPRVTAERERI